MTAVGASLVASGRVVGVDFDNTVICYDALMHAIARREGMIPEDVPRSKDAIRAHLRRAPGGEAAWQRLQALAYGREIHSAPAMPGAIGFFRACHARGVPTFVVSHKTEHAASDPEGPSLRAAAVAWLRSNGFFGDSAGLSPDRVRFSDSRGEKVALIRALGCTHFIDDLPETFAEPTFPGGVYRILFARGMSGAAVGVALATSWDEAERMVLSDGG